MKFCLLELSGIIFSQIFLICRLVESKDAGIENRLHTIIEV